MIAILAGTAAFAQNPTEIVNGDLNSASAAGVWIGGVSGEAVTVFCNHAVTKHPVSAGDVCYLTEVSALGKNQVSISTNTMAVVPWTSEEIVAATEFTVDEHGAEAKTGITVGTVLVFDFTKHSLSKTVLRDKVPVLSLHLAKVPQ